MDRETERKFLVSGEDWRSGVVTRYRQGYLNLDKECTVRVRMAGDSAYITAKGETSGANRKEFEYQIPPHDAEQMLATL